jgi:hypothetical protein
MVSWALTENFNDMEINNALTFDDNSTILREGYKPLLCPVDADKKMHWCGLDSAAKVIHQLCPCCATILDNLSLPNAHWCSHFCNQWKAERRHDGYPNWKCYHKPIIIAEQIDMLREESDCLIQ